MAYVKVRPPVKIYHLTGKDNLNSILDDGVIRRFNDTECWFCESLDKMRAYMEQTVMCEGQALLRRRRSALSLSQVRAGGLCSPQAHAQSRKG